MIHDLPVGALIHTVDLTAGGRIDGVKQRRERLAQAEATPTAVTDIEHTLEFLLKRVFVVERRLLPVQRVTRGGAETTLPVLRPLAAVVHRIAYRVSSAFWKRLACERSALASVSNQSAISANPSVRAAFAMPGYMSEYSCVSPAMADFRLALVSPIGQSRGRVADQLEIFEVAVGMAGFTLSG